MSKEGLFRFRSDEWRLFGCALNEVINGFRVLDFEQTIGVDKARLEKLLQHLHTLHDADKLTLGADETRAIRNALRETIRKLGVEEFHPRTGYEFQQGEAMLAKLDSLVAENGTHDCDGFR